VPNEKSQGFPVEAVTPTDGTGAEISSMSIVKGARNMESAKKFYEWALTPQAQQFAFAAKVFTFPSNVGTTLDPRVPDIKKINLINYDYAKYGSAAERRRIITNWERNVFSQAN
jgi:iron(III) transport system substrate-binding protein